MSKLLLPIFNFNFAKIFLEILSFSVNENSYEANLFSHSGNPLLTMCLLYELLGNFTKKFFSLSNACRTMQAHIMTMVISYI